MATPAKKKAFELTLSFATEARKSSGDTFWKALEGLDLTNFKSKGVLTVTTAGHTASVISNPYLLRRIRLNKTSTALFEKKLSVLLR